MADTHFAHMNTHIFSYMITHTNCSKTPQRLCLIH